MEENKVLRIVYTFFVGLLLAIFVGVGISTFYPSPKMPEYPPAVISEANKPPSDEQVNKQQEYDKKYADYNAKYKPYNRNVSIITLVAAVVMLAASIIFEKRIKLLSDGVMLGGLFTLVYSLGRGFASEDSKYLFVAVTISLGIVLYLGYHRFVRPAKPTVANKKAKK